MSQSDHSKNSFVVADQTYEHSLLKNYREAENYLKQVAVEERDAVIQDMNFQKAQKAFARCELILNQASFKVRHIKIRNLRRLSELEITFDDRLTVLIGENATGKTTVCESLTKALSWVLSAIKRENIAGIEIAEDDIKMGEMSAGITVDMELDAHNKIHFALERSLQDGAVAEKSDFKQLEDYARVIRECITADDCHITLPLFIFYSVNRPNFVRGARKIHLNRASAYDHALEEKVRISDMIEWFVTLENLSHQESGSELRDLIQFKGLLEGTLADFLDEESKADPMKRALLEDALGGIRQKIAETDEKIEALQCRPVNTAQKLKKIVSEIVCDLIPNAEGIFVDRSTGKDRVVLSIYGELHDIQYLSHGQRSVLFMVADLISRLEILNPHLEDPRESPGVVIIDEIELHLHPTWQQTIIDSLLKIFPNMQFVITTHSPQVISTVHNNQIRFLTNDYKTNQVRVHSPSFQTRGLSADNILLRILNIADVPNVPEYRQYQELEKMIENGEDETPEGKALYQRLENHFGKGSVEMEKIRHQQKLQALKARIRKRRKSSESQA